MRAGYPALKNGLLYGVILGICEIALAIVFGTAGLIINVLLFVFLVGYAGYRASSYTGKVSTGLVAGLVVGLLSSVIASVPLLIYYLANRDAFLVQMRQQVAGNSMYQGITLTNDLVLASVILFLVVLVAGATLLGLGIGSIGGAFGKPRAPSPSVPQYSSSLPSYPPQSYTPPPAQEYKTLIPPFDYTSPDAYMLPQEHSQSQKESGQLRSQE